MVPGKGNISKGKGAANAKASTSVTKVKRERVSEPEDSDEEVLLADVKAIDYAKVLPRFTSSKVFKLYYMVLFSMILTHLFLQSLDDQKIVVL